MAVLTRPCTEFPCLRQSCRSAASRNGLIIRSACSLIKTQLCTLAVSLTLFNSARLPREASKYGALPYLVAYSAWMLFVCISTSLLQLVTGQLSQQDPIGVWRAVPIFRGVGHIQLIESYICCIYNMLYLALAAAYMLWITKDGFPLRACTQLQITPNGYVNKMNASECFHSTFLTSFNRHPQYIGIMAIIVFVLWFFIPLLLYGLKKSIKISLSVITPITLIIGIVVASFLSEVAPLQTLLLSCEQWMVFKEPYIWFSTLVQALLSTQISSGYLISAGGTIYKHTDIRWLSITTVFYNVIAGWMWVILWQSISADLQQEPSFLSVLILIYQSSISRERNKLWPILAFGLIFASGIITIMILLYSIFDRLQRFTGDKWKLVAAIASAAGTCFTLGVLYKAIDVATALDELVVPILVVFATTFQVIGFVFVYGCRLLRLDVEFMTGSKTSRIWIAFWCLTPFLIIAVTGWWLRVLLRDSYGAMKPLWPLGGALIGILVIMAVVAAVAVAKEEQFNLLSKIAAAFRPSRMWGPEDPTVRYNWMIQRFLCSNEINDRESVGSYSYPPPITSKINEKSDWINEPITDYYQKYLSNIYENDFYPKPLSKPFVNLGSAIYAIPKKKKEIDNKFLSPNICIAKDELDNRVGCNCNRHFTLNVPYSMTNNNETTTSL